MKSGYTLSEEEQAEIDEIMASFETAATANGLRDAGAFVSFYYGKGNTLDSVRELITRGYIASGYAQQQFDSYSYTTEELDAYYDEHKDELDAFSFNYYLVAAEQVEVTETVTGRRRPARRPSRPPSAPPRRPWPRPRRPPSGCTTSSSPGARSRP